MAKKTKKNNDSEVVKSTSEIKVNDNEQNVDINNNDIDITDNEFIITDNIKDGSKLCIDEKYVELGNISTIKGYGIHCMSLFDLIQLEKACALLCKRFETSARIDRENNEKFKEYKGYYEQIFAELENRVSEVCK
jgi:hypothetical protein